MGLEKIQNPFFFFSPWGNLQRGFSSEDACYSQLSLGFCKINYWFLLQQKTAFWGVWCILFSFFADTLCERACAQHAHTILPDGARSYEH